MTTLELYRKHKKGEVSREKFLYEVRRDNNLPFITNLTSYDDAVKILKNKGIVNEVETKEAKADEAVKAEVKAKAPSNKKPESLHIDQANPYEYRHGLSHELNELGEYTDEALEKAKTTVLKNLAKDANFYSTLLNQKQSSFEFKTSETDAKGMQANADGTLKKGAGKVEKANVQDTLGKKEAGKKKPKGIKIMPDKGVTGSEKTIKEGLEETQIKVGDIVVPNKGEHKGQKHKVIHVFDDGSMNIQPIGLKAKDIKYRQGAVKAKPEDIEEGLYEDSDENYDIFMDGVLDVLVKDKLITKADLKALNSGGADELMDALHDEWKGFESYEETGQAISRSDLNLAARAVAKKLGKIQEDVTEIMPGVDLGASFEKMKGGMNAEDEFESLVKKYDWYAEMSDDSRKWNAQQDMERQLSKLAKTIGVDKAVEIFNRYAPSDRKVTSDDTMWMKEDKHAKIKEALKKALKEADPAMTKIEKDEENAEKVLASILQKKAAILNKPGTQG